MPKRVSLKGRGADIFFGEYAPSPAEPTASEIPGEQHQDHAAASPAPVASEQPRPLLPANKARARNASIARGTKSSANQSTVQPTDQSTNRPTSRPFSDPTDKVVDRPKAFYITEKLDRQLDDAVRYFQIHHGLRKVDRSILLTTMLSDELLWTDAALDQLVDRLLSQLTSRLRR